MRPHRKNREPPATLDGRGAEEMSHAGSGRNQHVAGKLSTFGRALRLLAHYFEAFFNWFARDRLKKGCAIASGLITPIDSGSFVARFAACRDFLTV